jgi:CRISPR-associated protein Cmr6
MRMRRIQNVTVHNVQEKYGHAGLWHDKYLPDFEPQTKQTHLDEVTQICKHTEAYADYYRRWKDLLKRAQAYTVELVTQSRMIVGIGEASVRDIGIMLHHTYGVPFIPGSSLKGLAAAYARKLPGWEPNSESYRTLFGDGRQSGVVDFMDAIWVPDPLIHPLSVDIINVHYQSYYTNFGKGNNDQEVQRMFMEAPVPNYFVCVKPKVTLLLAVNGPVEWTQSAMQLLQLAADEVGVGAKTNAGYGRLHNSEEPRTFRHVEDASTSNVDDELIAKFISDHLQIAPKNIVSQLPNKRQPLRDLVASNYVKRSIAQHMLKMAKDAGVGKDKAWHAELVEIAQLPDS